MGVYVIDQPEDQISQVAIKKHVLDAFKRMSANRQVLMITHNPALHRNSTSITSSCSRAAKMGRLT